MKRVVAIIILWLSFCLVKGTCQSISYGLRLLNKEQEQLVPSMKHLEEERFSDSSLLILRVNKVVTLLHRKGYLEAGVDKMRFKGHVAFVKFHVGQRYAWGKIRFVGWKNESSDSFHITFDGEDRFSGAWVNFDHFFKFIEKAIGERENRGYPFAQVVGDSVRFCENQMEGTWRGLLNSYFQWDSLVVKGPLQIRDRFLQRYLGVRPGLPYNEKRVKDCSKRIRSLSFAKEIKPSEVEFEPGKAALFLYLDKQASNEFEGIIGVQTNSLKKGKTDISGDIRLVLENSLGAGEHLSFHWQKLETNTQRLNTKIEIPYLFGSSVGVDFNFQLFKQDTSFLNVQTQLGLQFMGEGANFVELLVRYKKSSQLSGNSSAETSGLAQLADSYALIYGVGGGFKNLDALYNPRKGWDVRFELGTGNRRVKSVSGILNNEKIPGSSPLVEGHWDVSRYLSMGRRWVFKARNTGGILHNGSLFQNDLYRLGGLKTLRGFDEGAISASVYTIVNGEFRFLPESSTSFYLFWDGGWFRKEVFGEKQQRYLWGTGLGMNFSTGAGIFSLNYALGKSAHSPLQFRSAKIHFGFVSRF